MDMKEEWIKIYESPVTNINSKIWLQELLEENNIPFRKKIEHSWTGSVKQPKYNEKVVIYVYPKFKLQVEKYIEEFNNEDNILSNDIEELKTNDDTEYEAKKISKKQKIMQRILIGIVIAMVSSIIVAAILTQ